ncbi:MAG: DNA-3-methyladenine glycosylase [Phycisphaerales bacterium]|nr:DNA-3-methyladenine glycosylase [Phycisphaerales bacterium]
MTARFVDFAVDPVTLARRLLGQRLVRVLDGERVAGRIVEVEAYLGVSDRAAHSRGGHRSARNESMFCAGGHLYVYFTYGMHWCANVVCGAVDEPVAVLLRAVEPEEGLESMARRRPKVCRETDLCSGPARLAQAFGIDGTLDRIDLRTSNVMWIERIRRRAVSSRLVVRGPRIGVGYAGDWASRPLRFHLRDNPHVSGPRRSGGERSGSK